MHTVFLNLVESDVMNSVAAVEYHVFQMYYQQCLMLQLTLLFRHSLLPLLALMGAVIRALRSEPSR